MHTQAEDFLKENPESEASSILSSLESIQQNAPDTSASDIDGPKLQDQRLEETVDAAGAEPSHDGGNSLQESIRSSVSGIEAEATSQSSENGSQSLDTSRSGRERETQVIEQFEPGVYVSLIVRPNGNKVFKRVKFRYLICLLYNKFHTLMSECQCAIYA